MNTKSNKAQKKPTLNKRVRNVLIGLGIVILIIFLADKLLFGYVNYYSAWLQCGQKPLILNTFSVPTQYIKEADQGYFIGSMNTYICSEQEAVQKGYKHQTQDM
jgi:hypothetical protein